MLEKFGLSSYENKVYMKLLELDDRDARTISTKSGVPYGRIYDVLDSLVSNRLVMENKGRPKTYRAIDPERAVTSLLDNQKRKFSDLEKQATTTIQQLKPIYESTPRDKLVWKVAIGEELYSDYANFVSDAKNEYLGYMEVTAHSLIENSFDTLEFYAEVLSNLVRNNVKIKILFGIESPKLLLQILQEEPRLRVLMESIEIRTSEIITHPFTVLDQNKVILKIINPSNTNEMIASLYLWEKKLANTMRQEFFTIWENSKPLKMQLKSIN